MKKNKVGFIGAGYMGCGMAKNLIKNFDVYIIANKNRMIDIIAKLCEINKNRINIKGKSTEKLGIIGKEKAIACEVIASVIKYD